MIDFRIITNILSIYSKIEIYHIKLYDTTLIVNRIQPPANTANIAE